MAVSQPSPLHISQVVDWFTRAWLAGYQYPRAGREKRRRVDYQLQSPHTPLWRANRTTWTKLGMDGTGETHHLQSPEGRARQGMELNPSPLPAMQVSTPLGRTSNAMKSFSLDRDVMGCNRFHARQTATAGYGSSRLLPTSNYQCLTSRLDVRPMSITDERTCVLRPIQAGYVSHHPSAGSGPSDLTAGLLHQQAAIVR